MYYLHHQDMHIAKHIILGKKIGQMTKPFFTNKMVCIKQI